MLTADALQEARNMTFVVREGRNFEWSYLEVESIILQAYGGARRSNKSHRTSSVGHQHLVLGGLLAVPPKQRERTEI